MSQETELEVMKESIKALRELTEEIRQHNREFHLVLFGDSARGITGLVVQIQSVQDCLSKVDRRIAFYTGAISVFAVIVPILVSYFLMR